MTNKYKKDGMVAVLFSPGYGAGWASSAFGSENLDIIFDPWIVDVLLTSMLKSEKIEKIRTYCALKYPDQYLGGLEDLTVTFLPEGTDFIIEEYDGNEYITIKDRVKWITA